MVAVVVVVAAARGGVGGNPKIVRAMTSALYSRTPRLTLLLLDSFASPLP